MPEKSRLYGPKKRSGDAKKFNGRKDIAGLYDTPWRAYRERFLAANPDCYSCGRVATVVDHVRPHKGNLQLFKKCDNHIPLCETCHNKITAIFDKKFVIGASINPKLYWLSQERGRRSYGRPAPVKVLTHYAEVGDQIIVG